MTLVGVSFDEPAVNAAFRADQSFQYELWSDTDRTLAMYYGAATSADQTRARRVSVILDADGTLLLEYPSVVAATHPQEVLEDCTVLFGG